MPHRLPTFRKLFLSIFRRQICRWTFETLNFPTFQSINSMLLMSIYRCSLWPRKLYDETIINAIKSPWKIKRARFFYFFIFLPKVSQSLIGMRRYDGIRVTFLFNCGTPTWLHFTQLRCYSWDLEDAIIHFWRAVSCITKMDWKLKVTWNSKSTHK